MRIVFSKDRAAQLDLLLRSLALNALPDSTAVVWRASPIYADFYWNGYATLLRERREVLSYLQREDDFETCVREALARAGDFVTFLCDDDVLYLDITTLSPSPGELLAAHPEILCFSLRLGLNTTYCYPHNCRQAVPLVAPIDQAILWDWPGQPYDWGYPHSLDGHIFRTADVQAALEGRHWSNPNTLEDELGAGLRELDPHWSRGRMASYFHSALVGVPVNQTTETHRTNRNGETHGVSAEDLNGRYLAGWRLALDSVVAAEVDAAHREFPLRWEARSEAVA